MLAVTYTFCLLCSDHWYCFSMVNYLRRLESIWVFSLGLLLLLFDLALLLCLERLLRKISQSNLPWQRSLFLFLISRAYVNLELNRIRSHFEALHLLWRCTIWLLAYVIPHYSGRARDIASYLCCHTWTNESPIAGRVKMELWYRTIWLMIRSKLSVLGRSILLCSSLWCFLNTKHARLQEQAPCVDPQYCREYSRN